MNIKARVPYLFGYKAVSSISGITPNVLVILMGFSLLKQSQKSRSVIVSEGKTHITVEELYVACYFPMGSSHMFRQHTHFSLHCHHHHLHHYCVRRMFLTAQTVDLREGFSVETELQPL